MRSAGWKSSGRGLPSRARVGAAAWLIVGWAVAGGVAGCSKDASGPDPNEDPPPVETGFPQKLSELRASTTLRPYAPRYQLWSNGLLKSREIHIPAGSQINAVARNFWEFPEGTVFLKTFSYRPASAPNSVHRVETRALRRIPGAWETAVYLWDAQQSDALLQDGNDAIAVHVEDNQGRVYDHMVPSRFQCFQCHANTPSFILGFRELQLNGPAPAGGSSYLERFHSEGLFSTPLPTDPDSIVAPDPITHEVLGYVEANCVHCHNGLFLFDLRHGSFFTNTVGQTGRQGIRLDPGNPEGSALYRLFQSGTMPTLGVQVQDSASIATLYDWIRTFDFGS